MKRLNTEQAMQKLGFTHRNSLFDRVKVGAVTRHKDGRNNYYLEDELDAYLQRKANPPTIYTTPSEQMLKTGIPFGWDD